MGQVSEFEKDNVPCNVALESYFFFQGTIAENHKAFSQSVHAISNSVIGAYRQVICCKFLEEQEMNASVHLHVELCRRLKTGSLD